MAKRITSGKREREKLKQTKRQDKQKNIPIIYLKLIYIVDIQIFITIIQFYYHIENLLSVFFFIFLLI